MSSLPAAVLWDCDGTLIDSEPMWFDVETALALELGRALPEDAHETNVGGTAATTAEYIRVHSGTDLPHADVLARLLQASEDAVRAGVVFMPGARELVESFRTAGVPQAMVSSSRSAYLRAVLESWPGHPFDVVVSSDDVTRSKPDPEPYLKAAEALGVSAVDCWVFEDSVTGASAGLRSGAFVFVAPEPGHTPPPPAPRLRVLDGLAGLGIDALTAMVRA